MLINFMEILSKSIDDSDSDVGSGGYMLYIIDQF